MKIKKIDIHGFKSFVDKTSLLFPRGVTGIVGPNGCGKSNIVDAIRWVLGEHNPRHLRGKLMEDVIFNGSESRKPIGMAEVALTLSNDEGIAPAEYVNFTEIEIARRLYRSGESEYCINKYKHRKDAALRRLEGTKQNLTRVNDIISEVKRQMNSLNRQAKKAERYKALKDELKTLELTLSSLEFTKMREALSKVSKRLEAVKDEEIAAGTLIAAKEEQAEELKVEHLGVEGEYKNIRERVFECERAIQTEEQGRALAGMRTEELRRGQQRPD